MRTAGFNSSKFVRHRLQVELWRGRKKRRGISDSVTPEEPEENQVVVDGSPVVADGEPVVFTAGNG